MEPSPTRERLIRAATALFRRHGVSGTGIGAICERAGVTKGVFTHHFPSGKQELVGTVIRRNASEVGAAIAHAVDERRAADAVRGLFDGYAELLRSHGEDFGCPVVASVVDSAATSPAVRRAAGQAFASWRSALDGALRDQPPVEGLDTLLVAAFEGGILLARADGDPATMERVGGALAALIDQATLRDAERPVQPGGSDERGTS